jgi:hypothetical protein
MNERKYELMEKHLKGELTVIDLIDRIVELEGATQLNAIKDAYTVKEYIFDSRADAERVLNELAEYADKYSAVPVAHYYDLLCVESMYVDNKYGWSYGTLKMGAVIQPYRTYSSYNTYGNRRNVGRYVIKFPPVEVL